MLKRLQALRVLDRSVPSRHLFQSMQCDATRPSIITYNTLSGICTLVAGMKHAGGWIMQMSSVLNRSSWRVSVLLFYNINWCSCFHPSNVALVMRLRSTHTIGWHVMSFDSHLASGDRRCVRVRTGFLFHDVSWCVIFQSKRSNISGFALEGATKTLAFQRPRHSMIGFVYIRWFFTWYHGKSQFNHYLG